MSRTAEANEPRHYIVMTAAIIIGVAGIYVRFLGDEAIWSWIGNALMVVATVIALKSVFGILASKTND